MNLLMTAYHGRWYEARDALNLIRALPTLGAAPLLRLGLATTPPDALSYREFSENGLSAARHEHTTAGVVSLDILQKSAFATIETTLSTTKGRLSIHPYVHPDDTTTYELEISLKPGQERDLLGQVLPTLFPEGALMRFLESVDPIWSVLGVAPYPPSLGELRSGEEVLPSVGGYLGSEVVALIGKRVLERALRTCQKVEWTSQDGLFFDWKWRESRKNAADAQLAFGELLKPLSFQIGTSLRRQAKRH